MIANDIYQVCIKQAQDEQAVLNIIYGRISDPPTNDNEQENCEALAQSVSDSLGASMRNLQSFTLRHDSVTCQQVYPSNPLGSEVLVGIFGQVSDDSLPSFVQARWYKQGPTRARKNRGHFYLGGIPEPSSADNEWNDTVWGSADIQDVADFFVELFDFGVDDTAGQLRWIIPHGTTFGGGEGVGWDFIVGCHQKRDFGTMRSRRRRPNLG